MRLARYVLVAVIASSPVHAAQAAESIVGAFEVKMGKPGNSVEIQLACESESSCTFTTISQWESNSPSKEQLAFKQVRPVENPWEAVKALQYAIGQRGREIRNEEFAEPMRKLSPVLSSGPSIAKCWDLGYQDAGYMLACTLKDAPAGSPPVYLFGTLLANCGEGFCRYVIYPMTRRAADAKD